MIDFLYNLYPIEEIIPSIVRLYNGMEETLEITTKIINDTSLLNNYSHIQYLDNYKPIEYIYNVNQIYLNNNYWDHLIRRSSICQSNYNNHFNWDFLASGIVLKLGKSELWTATFPISNYDYIWLIDSISIFKVKFQGFIIPNILDISYITEDSLKHHDYVRGSMLSTNISWHKNMNPINHPNYGLFLLWYEHYGAVEIGLKAIFTYWYQLCYPQIEEILTLTEVPYLYPISISDKAYLFKLYKVIQNIKSI